MAPTYTTGDVVAAGLIGFGPGIAVGAMMSGGCCSWGYSSWNCGWHGTAVVYHGGGYYGNSAWHGGYYNGGYHSSYGYNNSYNHSNYNNNHSNYNSNYKNVSGNTINVNKQSAQNFQSAHSSASNSWAQHDSGSGSTPTPSAAQVVTLAVPTDGPRGQKVVAAGEACTPVDLVVADSAAAVVVSAAVVSDARG